MQQPRLDDAGRGESAQLSAIVVIGKNEGARLRACIRSLGSHARRVVYVDSGSTDSSVEWAREQGIDVVEMQPVVRFSAAAARNEGFRQCRERWPDVALVQFVDGDCELAPGWLEHAAEALNADGSLAAVCGRLREKDPTATVYKHLCDLEFRGTPGLVSAVGGIFMARAVAFEAVGGFDPTVVAGEEPEMCYRLRREGWHIARLDAEMGDHESAMTQFRQWWMRMERGGFAYANGRRLHGRGPERYCVAETRSILAWTLGLAAASALAVAVLGLPGLALLSLLPLQATRVAIRRRRGGDTASEASLYAAFVMLGKWAQLKGVLRHWVSPREHVAFDYKTLASSSPEAPSPTKNTR